ncbi:Hypothetical protein SMAX5B_013636 [Scophthalmus maximus]|uniref:Uncharacterized protein n=1 Tax=Scophthalmus maximus TaxID=52904 RepID=A0A2U9BEP7_SCOMX|nr:Hypothetical protein SMAX5B_013636 [Scophthalmus maximus]
MLLRTLANFPETVRVSRRLQREDLQKIRGERVGALPKAYGNAPAAVSASPEKCPDPIFLTFSNVKSGNGFRLHRLTVFTQIEYGVYTRRSDKSKPPADPSFNVLAFHPVSAHWSRGMRLHSTSNWPSFDFPTCSVTVSHTVVTLTSVTQTDTCQSSQNCLCVSSSFRRLL